MSEKLLTVAEAATTLRLHPVTLRALAAADELPAFKIGRAWRFNISIYRFDLKMRMPRTEVQASQLHSQTV